MDRYSLRLEKILEKNNIKILMPIATHIVKVRGTFDEKIWNEKKLKYYVNNKIKNDIDKSFLYPSVDYSRY